MNAPAKSKTCGNCANFEEARHPSGRLNKKASGRCSYVVAWPQKIPMIYNWREPSTYRPWYEMEANKCPCWETRAVGQNRRD